MVTYASLDAIGDRTRREVLEQLRTGPASVGELASRLPVSRPAVSQHLRTLHDAGLVTFTREGTRHVYAVDRAALAELRGWFDAFWDVALERYASAAARAGAAAQAGDAEERTAETPAQAPKKPKKRGKRKKKSRKERG